MESWAQPPGVKVQWSPRHIDGRDGQAPPPSPPALGRGQGWGQCGKVHIGVNDSLLSGVGVKGHCAGPPGGDRPLSALRKPHG